MLNIVKKQAVVLCFSALLLITLILAAGLSRPLFPVNETLYTGVAWDMWTQHHILVPIMNGHLYNQKPPLFFWLLDWGWSLFGANNWWPRLLPGLCAAGSMYLALRSAEKLFEKTDNIGLITLALIMGSAYWAYYLPRTRIDQLLCLCVMFSVYGTALAIKTQQKGWWWFALGNGLGLLTKGPIVFLFTLPLALLAPRFVDIPARQHWHRRLLIATLLALSIAALWALPLLFTHPEYAKSILWDQTANRLSDHGTVHPWYYYIIRLPLLLAPWFFWPSIWQNKHSTVKDPIERLLRYSLLITFLALCCIGPKASRFLLPALPIFALWLGYRLMQIPYRPWRYQNDCIAFALLVVGIAVLCTPAITRLITPQAIWLSHFNPWWGFVFIALSIVWLFDPKTLLTTIALLSSTVVIGTTLFYLTIVHAISPLYDLTQFSAYLKQLQLQGHPIAYVGHYDDRFQFLGRLKIPLTVLGYGEETRFANTHPNSYLIEVKPYTHTVVGHPILQQRYRSHEQLLLWKATHFRPKGSL